MTTGSPFAFTLTGSMTGRGGDMAIIDDPQAAHATDPTTCAAICEWYDRNVYQRRAHFNGVSRELEAEDEIEGTRSQG